MTRNEKRILRSAINAVAHHNKVLWWELKRQVFDYGDQSYYPRQSEYELPAKRVVAGLSDIEKASLLSEWRNARPPRPEWTDEQILAYYARLIVEEIVERARVAAYTTSNW
ncbi:MAG: hypothetical protein IH606_11975 [Burkholderiales bacterium]|nr:hypothetical protein [Burkholderiales bacterium]